MTFGVLGTFSTKYRLLYREALTCIKNKIKGLHCPNYNIWKTKIIAKLEKFPRSQIFVGRHFDAITNTLVVIFILIFAMSGFFLGNGIYNYAVYGDCNGPHSEEFCIFDPFSAESSCGSEHCAEEGCDCGPKDVNCTAETNFAPCEGDCECNEEVCG